MTRFLRSKLTPTLMGFDPLMQIIHEADAVEALSAQPVPRRVGRVQCGRRGGAPVEQVDGLGGKPMAAPIFHLAAYWGNPLLGALGMPVSRAWPIELDYLRYPWVGDLCKMREESNSRRRRRLSRPAGIHRPAPAGALHERRRQVGAGGRVAPQHDRTPPQGQAEKRPTATHKTIRAWSRARRICMSGNSIHPRCAALTRAGEPCRKKLTRWPIHLSAGHTSRPLPPRPGRSLPGGLRQNYQAGASIA